MFLFKDGLFSSAFHLEIISRRVTDSQTVVTERFKSSLTLTCKSLTLLPTPSLINFPIAYFLCVCRDTVTLR